MSVNAVNFRSQMAAQPLRSNQHVSFAARKENAEQTEAPKKSNTGKWIAAGVALATVAAGIVFRKDISKFVKNINLGGMKNKAAELGVKVKEAGVNGFEKVKDLAKATVERAKEVAGQVKVDGVKNAASGLGTKIANGFKTGWNAIKTGFNFVKDLCVKVGKWIASLFAKPQAPVV